MECDFLDFLIEDELSSITLVVEDQKLFVHREVLAAWSPVFRAMFVGMFKERNTKEVELPDKKVEDFIELLHCMYPPIHPITGQSLYFVIFCSVTSAIEVLCAFVLISVVWPHC